MNTNLKDISAPSYSSAMHRYTSQSCTPESKLIDKTEDAFYSTFTLWGMLKQRSNPSRVQPAILIKILHVISHFKCTEIKIYAPTDKSILLPGMSSVWLWGEKKGTIQFWFLFNAEKYFRKVECRKNMLVLVQVLLLTKTEQRGFWYHLGHTLPQTSNAVHGKFTHMKPDTWMQRWRTMDTEPLHKWSSGLVCQWLSDKTLKIVGKMIAHSHDQSCHQILKCAAMGFFSWQAGIGCSYSFQKHVLSSKLNWSLGAKRHCKLILSMSVTAYAALDFSHKFYIVIFC